MGRTTVWIDANEIKDMDGNDLEIIDANAQALRTLTLVLGIEEEGEGEGKGEGEVVTHITGTRPLSQSLTHTQTHEQTNIANIAPIRTAPSSICVRAHALVLREN